MKPDANPARPPPNHQIDWRHLASRIRTWADALGFQQTGFTDCDLSRHETRLLDWLNTGFHGDMDYMQRHGTTRSRPAELVPGTIRVISVRMDYFPENCRPIEDNLATADDAFVSRYALGRDYHKLIRNRLQKLAEKIEQVVGPFGYRAFTDSAPVLEKALAEKAGLGWIGKHTNIINEKNGSWFFLGELYTNLPLPIDIPADNHCGTCTACLDACPTRAIVAPYRLDARRCISYLTIELRSSIPVQLRPLIGNRIYGCDDCQMVCPWNRFAKYSGESDFNPRNDLDGRTLISLFSWSEAEFQSRTEGSAIRRIGYECWLRNIAVALGNAPASAEITDALEQRATHASALVREHVAWALERQASRG